ncbi:hypothetical protein ACEWY4_018238 [Coilia grayii]|uniref:DDE Tnp4 domain-containing protein n=1 Tax=Coilia grayii TaxID=363190 RepID=A0ABD1JJB0_9TELE
MDRFVKRKRRWTMMKKKRFRRRGQRCRWLTRRAVGRRTFLTVRVKFQQLPQMCREWYDDFHRLVKELRLDSELFQQYFRMPRKLYDLLLRRVGPRITKWNPFFRQALGPAQHLPICLRTHLEKGKAVFRDFFNSLDDEVSFYKPIQKNKVDFFRQHAGSDTSQQGICFRTIAFSYRVGLSTVCMVVKEVSAAIWEELQPEFMPTPSMDDWLAIAEGFRHRWNFPNCVGSVDGKHVVLQAPANSGSQFFNYKGTFSIVPLAVVDAHYLFRVVDVGGYGRTSDGGILWNCFLGKVYETAPWIFHKTPDLMWPYPGPHSPGEKRAFNYRLSCARLVVECAFGILSSQWRMYRRVMAVSPTTAETCVRATCVLLHNFLRVLTLRRRQYQNQPYTSRRPGDPDVCEECPGWGPTTQHERHWE